MSRPPLPPVLPDSRGTIHTHRITGCFAHMLKRSDLVLPQELSSSSTKEEVYNSFHGAGCFSQPRFDFRLAEYISEKGNEPNLLYTMNSNYLKVPVTNSNNYHYLIIHSNRIMSVWIHLIVHPSNCLYSPQVSTRSAGGSCGRSCFHESYIIYWRSHPLTGYSRLLTVSVRDIVWIWQADVQNVQ